jgi:hypothetical protein
MRNSRDRCLHSLVLKVSDTNLVVKKNALHTHYHHSRCPSAGAAKKMRDELETHQVIESNVHAPTLHQAGELTSCMSPVTITLQCPSSADFGTSSECM